MLAALDLLMLGFTLSDISDEQLDGLYNSIGLVSSAVGIYVLLSAHTALRYGLRIKGTASHIFPLIIFSLLYAILPWLDSQPIDYQGMELSLVDMILAISLIPYGIITARLGYKIQQCQYIYPNLNITAGLMIAAGLCIASMIFVMIAIPIYIVIYILAAKMFYHAYQQYLR